MRSSLENLLKGYQQFKKRYGEGEGALMKKLAEGQKPEVLVVGCADSRVDPAVILGASPGQLFVVRNVANIVPPYQADDGYHGTSSALEFGVCGLGVKHLILWGHSSCGGMAALFDASQKKAQAEGSASGRALAGNAQLADHACPEPHSFISPWVNIVAKAAGDAQSVDDLAQKALHISYQNALSFPWIQSRVEAGQLMIHRWFFRIQTAEILAFDEALNAYQPLVP